MALLFLLSHLDVVPTQTFQDKSITGVKRCCTFSCSGHAPPQPSRLPTLNASLTPPPPQRSLQDFIPLAILPQKLRHRGWDLAVVGDDDIVDPFLASMDLYYPGINATVLFGEEFAHMDVPKYEHRFVCACVCVPRPFHPF